MMLHVPLVRRRMNLVIYTGMHLVVTAAFRPCSNKTSLRKSEHNCLFFFHIAEMHMLPHSITNLLSDFKTSFVEFTGMLPKQIENIPPAAITEELRSLLAPDFFSDIFETVETKHQRVKFARQYLAYVKP